MILNPFPLVCVSPCSMLLPKAGARTLVVCRGKTGPVQSGTSWKSDVEALVATKLAKDMTESKSIGVITLYTAQQALLEQVCSMFFFSWLVFEKKHTTIVFERCEECVRGHRGRISRRRM
jgi:hypothetical protein